jgi:hypothetical protein
LGLHLIDSPGTDGSPAPNPGSASRIARQGQLHDALRLVKSGLARDESRHYEALLLKAKLHRQLNHKWRTKLTLQKILGDPHLTEGQRRHAGSMLSYLDDRTHACWKI